MTQNQTGKAGKTGLANQANRANESAEYFEARSLKGGTVGAFLLMSLGVAYVISGDFSGWNYGIAYGGWLGLAIAFVLMGLMYVCTVFGEAEMSSALPTAGAGYGFARRAMGKFGGFITGLAITIEYVCAPAAISTFIANYFCELGILPADFPHIIIIAVAFIVFLAIHIIGVGEALKTMLVITAIGAVALVCFVVGAAPSFDPTNLFDIAPAASDGSTLLPYGASGLLAALPFGIWFFLGIEGVPLAAEEARDPKRDIPRGIIGAMFILVCSGACVLIFAAGVTGADIMGASAAPLVDALNAAGNPALAFFVNVAGLFGLIASFFSLIYAGSREIFALSRAGYLPRVLALTGKRKTPYLALIVQGIVGFLLAAILQDGDIILNIAVFGACVSYAMMNLSHVLLRKNEPDMPRGYRTPGGVVTTSIALVLSVIAIVSTFFVDITAACVVLVVFVVGSIYFFAYASKHLVANAPEEEFAQLEAAEAELR